MDLGGPSGAARIVTEIVYDAYGRVLAREDRSGTTPPDLRLGHKGLFFDRLDLGVADPITSADTPRLEPGSRLLGFVRNRSLHTQWGRWLQRDPNATGMVVNAGLNAHGQRIGVSVQGAELERHFTDGPNVYIYAGNTPLLESDPTGLFFSIAEAFTSATTAVGLQQEWSDQIFTAGVKVGTSISDKLAAYAFEQLLDLNWASNWAEADDMYRGSAEWAAGTGSWSMDAGGHGSSGGFVMAGWWEDVKKLSWEQRAPRVMGVYALYDDHGNIAYVGRSKDIAKRAAESAKRLGLDVKKAHLIAINNYDAVRALEDLGIRHNKLTSNGKNVINGMSRRNMSTVRQRYNELGRVLGKIR